MWSSLRMISVVVTSSAMIEESRFYELSVWCRCKLQMMLPSRWPVDASRPSYRRLNNLGLRVYDDSIVNLYGWDGWYFISNAGGSVFESYLAFLAFSNQFCTPYFIYLYRNNFFFFKKKVVDWPSRHPLHVLPIFHIQRRGSVSESYRAFLLANSNQTNKLYSTDKKLGFIASQK